MIAIPEFDGQLCATYYRRVKFASLDVDVLSVTEARVQFQE